jgi:hypothetical protein
VLSDIRDYDLRYYLMARFALAKKISCASTPNPTTLVRIAETAVEHQEEIIRSINDGVISCTRSFDWNREAPGIPDAIKALLKPNRSRARHLDRVISEHGRLIPSACWKELKIIGCWMGGSIGFQADKLTPLFGGHVPKRDLGYRASEGSMTIPYQDNTPAGILALHNNYYEFIPESEDSAANARPLLCHEIEQGRRYKIVITNYDGLYRYDIHDIVEVYGFYNLAPVIAFVRKSEDMLNITGEKLHANHFLKAFASLKEQHNVSVIQFRAIPNYDKARYEILAHLEPAPQAELLRNEILPFLDRQLSEANVEYETKRKSKRLNPPCIHVMDPSWEENVRRHSMAAGRRDIQYKWQMVASSMVDIDVQYVRQTIEM